MQTGKPINPGQLQKEALATGPHVELTIIGPVDPSTGIAASGATLLCSDAPGSSATQEPCQACMTAYNAHVAAPNPAPANANQALINQLNALTLTPGGEADLIRQTVVRTLQAQPSVPAI